MSREAVNEALRVLLGSTASMAALRGAEVLGPLRSMFLPLPLPAEVLMSLQPAVALNDEDRQTLDSLRVLMQLVSPESGGSSAVGGRMGPGLVGDVAAGAPRAMRAAGELMPLMPEIMPGLQSTLELFMRQLVRRIALRIADDLQPSAQQRPPTPYSSINNAANSPTPGGVPGSSSDESGYFGGGGAGMADGMMMPSPAFSYVSHLPQYPGAGGQQVRPLVAPPTPPGGKAAGGLNAPQGGGKKAGKPQGSSAWGLGGSSNAANGKRWA
jgi:aarF domain-containing kinase